MRGIYEPVLPLDYLVLEQLPKQGALISGIYPDAASVGDIVKKLSGTDSGLISSRMRTLGIFGLVKAIKIPRSPTQGYQITKEGERFLRERPGVHPVEEAGDGS